MDALRDLHAPGSRFPTSKRDYDLVTPMMSDVLDIVRGEIEGMSTGCTIFGPSRIGKSRSLAYVLAEIRRSYPTVTCVHAIMVSRSNRSDSRFFKGLAEDLNLGISLDGDGDDIRNSIVRHLLIRCSETQDPRVFIVLDEAQRIKPHEYSFLIDLTNHLEKYGMSPILLLSGQPELLQRREELIKQRRRDAIGRFLENPLAFSGVTSEENLKKILQQFDDASVMQYPANSKCCITAAYVPDLYKHGFRLSTLTPFFWRSIEESASQIKMASVIGMQNLTKAIEMALTSIAASGDPQIARSKEWWKVVLQDTGYLKHLLMISDTDS